MHLREWLARSDWSVKGFARKINVERAMVYRYFGGSVPRAKIIHRIAALTDGAVTAQDFYENALRQDLARTICGPPPSASRPAVAMSGSSVGKQQ